jgi:tadE family protein
MFYKIDLQKQKGASVTEILVVTPLVILLGMIGIQYALMYNAKTNITYASYEAARAGAINHADPQAIEDGLLKGLLPLLSTNLKSFKADTTNPLTATAQGKLALEKLKFDEARFMKIEIISPNEAAFNACNNVQLQKILNTTNKVIPNKHNDIQNYKCSDPNISISQANVLKLRITYGYKPKIPLAKDMFVSIASFVRGSQEKFDLKLLASDRIPITVDVSAQMLSPAVENGLQTKSYVPPKGDMPLPTGIKLPEGYENMSVDEIIDILSKEENGGAGSIGTAKSKKDWLAILVALGVIGAGAYQLGGDGGVELISDFAPGGGC